MDKIGADFLPPGHDQGLASWRASGGHAATRSVPKTTFKGVVDLIEMKAIIWNDESWARVGRLEIPDDLKDKAEEFARNDRGCRRADDDAWKPIWKARAGPTRRSRSCSARAVRNAFFPVLCGSAFKNKGVQPLLDAVVDYLPSPLEVPAIKGIDPKTEEEMVRKSSDDEPHVAAGLQDHERPVMASLTFAASIPARSPSRLMGF
jgi:elongation factor G